MGDVVGVFARCVFGALRARARDRLGLARTRCGAVTFIQRFGSALNLTPHFHMLAIDGVYAGGLGGKPEFFELPAPDDAEVADVVADTARRIQALIKRRGLSDSGSEEADPLLRDSPGLAAIAAASVQGRQISVCLLQAQFSWADGLRPTRIRYSGPAKNGLPPLVDIIGLIDRCGTPLPGSPGP